MLEFCLGCRPRDWGSWKVEEGSLEFCPIESLLETSAEMAFLVVEISEPLLWV